MAEETKKKTIKAEDKQVTTEKKTIGKKTTPAAIKKTAAINASLSVSVVDMAGKSAGKVDLPEDIFGAKINPTLMAQAVRVYLANQRQGTASTKTRGKVTASTRKIYRQKGTGRARHGANSAPIFVGGGVAHGPLPRDYSLDLPKKMRRAALFSALTQKHNDDSVVVLDANGASGKTKEVMSALKALNMVRKDGKTHKVLFVISGDTGAIKKAARNIEGLDLTSVNTLTTYEVLNHRHLLFLKDAVEVMSSVYLKK